ncbi:MAG: pyridoxal phosphate-dependent class II aminotransferase [Desulfobacterales bacterium]|jgi:threonine-phosphate decarboxylase
MLRGHGGNSIELARQLGCSPQDIIDMSSNINPLGPPPGLIRYLKHHIDAVGSFPEVDGRGISQRFADSCSIDPKRVLAGNGTTQIIYSIPQVLAVNNVLIVGPTYSDYADACHLQNVKTTFVLAEAVKNFQIDIHQIERHIDKADAIFICNPNNPTGSLIPSDELESLCRSYPETVFIIDESYLPFVPDGDSLSVRKLEYGNLMVLSSISKIFAIPGLRIGFVISADEIIEKFKRFLQPWSVNSLAQLAVDFLTTNEDEVEEFVERTRNFIIAERQRFLEAATKISDLQLFPSATNFLLAGLPEGLQSEPFISQLAHDKILLRNCQNFEGLTNRFIRVSLKTPEVNNMLVAKLAKIAWNTGTRIRQPKIEIRARR